MENVIAQIVEILKYGFIQKALIGGIMTGISCALLGVFLVLKKQSFIGDGLAHVSFASAACALLLGQEPFIISIPVVICVSFIILMIEERARINPDAAIALVSSISIALGVVFASVSKGFSVDLYGYLFGSILTIKSGEVILSIIVSILLITVVLLFYNELFISAFDSDFALVSGISTKRINYVTAIVTAVAIVTGIKVVGTMLISSLLIFPAVTALQIAKGFKQTLIISLIVSIFSVIAGIIFSVLANIPTGASIVLVNGIIFLFVFLIARKLR